MTRIQQLFEQRKADKRAALIAYITAGDPSAARTLDYARALEKGGVDLVELGLPFSDPIADGPVIQRASERALKAGMNVERALTAVHELRKTSQIPLLLFTYLNPVLRYGLEKLARDAKTAGIDGCLLTDVSVEEAAPYVNAMRAAALDTVFLAAPTSTGKRLELVAQYSSGFVYLVSRTGVTGERASLSESLPALIERMRRASSLPLAAGFGISTRQQAADVAKVCDGVIVGSAIVRLIEQNGSPESLTQFARSLREAMDAR